MNQSHCVKGVFELPPENHGHPGGISKVVMGPGAASDERPAALNTERLIIHTNEYVPEGISGEGHAHSDQEQAFYVIEGRMEVTVGEETSEIGPGDCVLLPRNVFHKHRNIGEGTLKFLFISVRLD